MKKMLIVTLLVCLTLSGCLSMFARKDFDQYKGASATWEGNGRTTTMATSQPAIAPVIEPVEQILRQTEPRIGEIFNLHLGGKVWEAMKKTDGKIYIIQEVR